jgi:hypothetical protein
MRVAFDLRTCVVFVGHRDGEKFLSCGTAFLFLHKGYVYLVTAAHVAEGLGDEPFDIRMNKIEGTGTVFVTVDLGMSTDPRGRWFLHEDPNVDLAVLPYHFDFASHGVEYAAVQTSALVEPRNPLEDVGCGDFCYVVGLFAKLQGERRNLPVVHTGHVALMPNRNELIDSRGPGGIMRHVEGYLVEVSSLQGLSGAPVFVRGGMEVEFPTDDGGTKVGIMASPDLKLMGIWQGSWEGHSLDHGVRVPVGMGVVTPSWKLTELLNSKPVTENLRQWLDKD